MLNYSEKYQDYIADAITTLGGLGYDMSKKIWILALQSYFSEEKIKIKTLLEIAHGIVEEYNYYGDFMEFKDNEFISCIDSALHEDPNNIDEKGKDKLEKILKEYLRENIELIKNISV